MRWHSIRQLVQNLVLGIKAPLTVRVVNRVEIRLSKNIVSCFALALASIPIAVAANSLRIVGTGLLVQYWDPDKAEGFFHIFSGWLVFVVSLAMLFLLHRLFQIGRRQIGRRNDGART